MDDPEPDFFSSTSRRPLRLRTSVVAQGSPGRGTSSKVLGARLRPSSQRLSPASASSPHQREIIAPVPRRHSALQSPDLRSPQWAPSSSPSSSRAVSPASSVHSTSAATSRPPPLSFSVLMAAHSRTRKIADSDQGDTLEAAGMGRRWIKWMHHHGMRMWVVPSAFLASALVKWCIGLGTYSGYNSPPMFGDYEAQRHWMELTIHLPVHQWYTYDLQYWGLDYPPLTAYISWLCGVAGSSINASWFALGTSRGVESAGSKLFMRATVLALDHIVYAPALWLFMRTWHVNRSRRTQSLALLTLLFQPPLLLIDFGHFQYNSVMLGFTLFSINFFMSGRDLLGAVCFVLSLGFKQMALYYAPAIGSYLIGKCLYLGPKEGMRLFLRLALVTLTSFIVIFLPFLPPFAPFSAIISPIMRIFPFNRGIFEDKVANFWCASNVVIKWKTWASRSALVRLSTLFTICGFIPVVVAPVRAWLSLKDEPSEREAKHEQKLASVPQVMQPVLLHSLLTGAMSFFLFSFQVHEKTILLPLMPLTLLLSAAPLDSSVFKIGALVNNVGIFSMWPLLRRDGQAISYVALTLLWNRLIGHNPLRLHKASIVDLLTLMVYAACCALHVLELLFLPPARYPDLYPVLNVLISTSVFVLTWLWSIKSLMQARWAVASLGPATRDRKLSVTSEKSHKESPTPTSENGSHVLDTSVPIRGLDRNGSLRSRSLGYSGRQRPLWVRAGSVSGEIDLSLE